MASLVFVEPEQGRTEGLRLRISRTSPSMRRRPRQALREAGDGTETIRITGPVLAATKRAGAYAGEKIRIRRSGQRPGRIKE